MDHLYDSHQFAEELLKKDIYSAGILGKNRNSKDTFETKLQKERKIARYSDKNIMIEKWK